MPQFLPFFHLLCVFATVDDLASAGYSETASHQRFNRAGSLAVISRRRKVSDPIYHHDLLISTTKSKATDRVFLTPGYCDVSLGWRRPRKVASSEKSCAPKPLKTVANLWASSHKQARPHERSSYRPQPTAWWCVRHSALTVRLQRRRRAQVSHIYIRSRSPVS